jgi:hypothetical protein
MPIARCLSLRVFLGDLSDEARNRRGCGENLAEDITTTPQASNSAIEAFFDLPLKYSASACPV